MSFQGLSAVHGDRGYVINGNGTVSVFDADTIALIDADPNAAGLNPIALPSGVIAADVAIRPDGTNVDIAGNDGKIYVVNGGSAAITV